MTSPNRVLGAPRARGRRRRAPLGRRLVMLAVGLALASGGLVAGSLVAGSPTAARPAAAMGPLPVCRYDDILTAPRGYDDWSTTLVDTILRVTKAYVPPDLVPVSEAGIGGTGKIREIAIADLSAMTAAALAHGTPIAVQSAYRSYTTQVSTFQYWVNLQGYKQALLYSARPGHSEHQLGLAIDFKSAAGGPPWSGSDWGLSPAGSWMKQHAWEYGWVQSYPKGKASKTCYDYESWHFRYVGRDLAAAIHASGLTPREYLWAHFTTAIVPPPGGSPSASQAPSSPPSAMPSADASPGAPSGDPSAQPSPASSPKGTDLGSPAGSEPPDQTAPPVFPAGSSGAVDPAVAIAGIALVVVLVALLGSVSLSRRGRGGMGPKSRSGTGLKG